MRWVGGEWRCRGPRLGLLWVVLCVSACFGGRAEVGVLGCPDGDADRDGICDSADLCPADDRLDSDGDGICDALDRCPGDDMADADGDRICDILDVCDGGDDTLDADNDDVCDALDRCPGFDDRADADGDGLPDCLDRCDYDGPTAPTFRTLPQPFGVAGFGIRSISIERAGRFAHVASGGSVLVDVEFDLVDCQCPGCIHQLYLGFYNEATPRLCIYNGIPTCDGDTGTFSGRMELPEGATQVGIQMGFNREFECTGVPWSNMTWKTFRSDDLAVVCTEESQAGVR